MFAEAHDLLTAYMKLQIQILDEWMHLSNIDFISFKMYEYTGFKIQRSSK